MFRREFSLEQPVVSSRLRVRAFRRFGVWLDGDFERSPPFYEGPAELTRWRQRCDISLPGPLRVGKHVLYVLVENSGGGMRRVPGDPRAVELPGGIRYRIGAAHQRWRGAVYLHRLPQLAVVSSGRPTARD
jgi:hypothetical protein